MNCLFIFGPINLLIVIWSGVRYMFMENVQLGNISSIGGGGNRVIQLQLPEDRDICHMCGTVQLSQNLCMQI